MNELLSQISKISNIIHNLGWAEATAGNFSINLTNSINDFNSSGQSIHEELFKRIQEILNENKNSLKFEQIILISSRNSSFYDLHFSPMNNMNLLFIRSMNSGTSEQNIVSFPLDRNSKAEPSSELQMHLSVQNQLLKNGNGDLCVLNCHPSSIIALSHLRQCCSQQQISDKLLKAHTETSFYFPDGVGFAEFDFPGSIQLASKVSAQFGRYNFVVVEKHGCVCSAKDLNSAFNVISVAEKAAEITLKVMSAGQSGNFGLTDEQLQSLLHYYSKK